MKGKSILSYFFYYSFCAVLISLSFVSAILFAPERKSDFIAINNVGFIFQYSFFGILIVDFVQSPEIKKLSKWLFGIFYLVAIYAIIIEIKYNFFLGFALANFGLLLLSLIFFYDLYNNFSAIPIREIPEVWFVLGVSFSTAITIPAYGFSRYFVNLNVMDFFFIVQVSLAIMAFINNAFFIKGILCFTNRRRLLS